MYLHFELALLNLHIIVALLGLISSFYFFLECLAAYFTSPFTCVLWRFLFFFNKGAGHFKIDHCLHIIVVVWSYMNQLFRILNALVMIHITIVALIGHILLLGILNTYVLD